MFVLLRQLQRARREIALPAPRRAGSLALRHVDAGSCNGCEHELTATANPYYDMQRHGLSIVASPRHADVLLVTGQITTRMAAPLRRAYEAMPEPRLVAALGDCAVGCAALGDPEQLAGALEGIVPVDLRIHGCPPTPQQIAEQLLGLMREATDSTSTHRTLTDSTIAPPESTAVRATGTTAPPTFAAVPTNDTTEGAEHA
jgi:Ni,Fe-hydrogenase III small subunit